MLLTLSPQRSSFSNCTFHFSPFQVGAVPCHCVPVPSPPLGHPHLVTSLLWSPASSLAKLAWGMEEAGAGVLQHCVPRWGQQDLDAACPRGHKDDRSSLWASEPWCL